MRQRRCESLRKRTLYARTREVTGERKTSIHFLDRCAVGGGYFDVGINETQSCITGATEVVTSSVIPWVILCTAHEPTWCNKLCLFEDRNDFNESVLDLRMTACMMDVYVWLEVLGRVGCGCCNWFGTNERGILSTTLIFFFPCKDSGWLIYGDLFKGHVYMICIISVENLKGVCSIAGIVKWKIYMKVALIISFLRRLILIELFYFYSRFMILIFVTMFHNLLSQLLKREEQ